MTTDALPENNDRLMSLDALRGFDMLLIIGADHIVESLNKASQAPVVRFFAGQFTHKPWEGMAFYDLIFPLFVFLVGVSLVYSLDKSLERGGTGSAVARLTRRSVLLYLLGVFYNGGISRHCKGPLDGSIAANCHFVPRRSAGVSRLPAKR